MNSTWSLLIESIEKRLAEREWKQADLARASGIPPKQLSSYMTGTTEPGFDKIEMIAKALGVQPADLIRPEDPSIPEAKRQLLALVRGMDENEAAWALEALDVLLRGLRGQPLRPDQPSKKVKDR